MDGCWTGIDRYQTGVGRLSGRCGQVVRQVWTGVRQVWAGSRAGVDRCQAGMDRFLGRCGQVVGQVWTGVRQVRAGVGRCRARGQHEWRVAVAAVWEEADGRWQSDFGFPFAESSVLWPGSRVAPQTTCATYLQSMTRSSPPAPSSTLCQRS